MKQLKINHVAVWILVVVQIIIAFIWYAPFLFGNTWMELLEKSEDDFTGASPLNYIVAIITAIAMTYMLAWLFKELNINTTLKGVLYALGFGISLFFLETLTQGLFALRPLGLMLIDGGMYLVSFLIVGIVLGSWKKYVE